MVSNLILYAKSLEMKFWIYDENGWPSGTAGGEVLTANPESRCEWLEMKSADEMDSSDSSIIHSFLLEGEQMHLILSTKSAISSLDPQANAYFIEITHKCYKEQLKPEAFDYVTGFFADEVAFLDGHSVTTLYGGVPWYKELQLMPWKDILETIIIRGLHIPLQLS